MDIWALSSFWILWIVVLRTWFFLSTYYQFFWVETWGGIVGSCGNSVSVLCFESVIQARCEHCRLLGERTVEVKLEEVVEPVRCCSKPSTPHMEKSKMENWGPRAALMLQALVYSSEVVAEPLWASFLPSFSFCLTWRSAELPRRSWVGALILLGGALRCMGLEGQTM